MKYLINNEGTGEALYIETESREMALSVQQVMTGGHTISNDAELDSLAWEIAEAYEEMTGETVKSTELPACKVIQYDEPDRYPEYSLVEIPPHYAGPHGHDYYYLDGVLYGQPSLKSGAFIPNDMESTEVSAFMEPLTDEEMKQVQDALRSR